MELADRRLLASLVAATAAVLAFASPALAASGNDNRAGAFTLSPDSASAVDTTGNTVEAGEPNIFGGGGGCAESFNDKLGATEWYRVTGTGGPLTITTDEPVIGGSPATAVDTVIFVYPQGSNTYTVCNDDLAPGTNYHSNVTFNSTAGQVYEVQVGTFTATTNPAGGEIVTTLRPVDDSRSFPTPITSGVPITGSNRYAALPAEAGEPLSCQPTPSTTTSYSRTVWFRFTAPGDGTAIIRTNGGPDTVEAVYRGDSTTPVACNDDIGGLVGPSGVTIPVTAGDYLIQVGGYGNPTADDKRGVWTQTVDFTATPPAQIPPPDQTPTAGQNPTPAQNPAPNAMKNAAPSTTLKSTKIAQHKVTFKFGSDEAGSTFLCRLDKAAFAICRSPKTYRNLNPGKHSFQVKARDAEGVLDPSPAVKKFKIEG